jgi:hypothetical protein
VCVSLLSSLESVRCMCCAPAPQHKLPVRQLPQGRVRVTMKAHLSKLVPEFANLPTEEDRDQIINMMSLRRWGAGAKLMTKGQEASPSLTLPNPTYL